jgi:hypothetical protein
MNEKMEKWRYEKGKKAFWDFSLLWFGIGWYGMAWHGMAWHFLFYSVLFCAWEFVVGWKKFRSGEAKAMYIHVHMDGRMDGWMNGIHEFDDHELSIRRYQSWAAFLAECALLTWLVVSFIAALGSLYTYVGGAHHRPGSMVPDEEHVSMRVCLFLFLFPL